MGQHDKGFHYFSQCNDEALCSRAYLVPVVLDQSGSIKDGVVAASNKLSGQVGAVVDGEQAPAISRDDLAGGGDIGGARSVQAVVVTTGTIDNVPGVSGISINLFSGTIPNGRVALVEVLVTGDDEIDTVLIEDGLESDLALDTLRGADIPGAVTSSNNPGSLLAVNGGEILLQPGKLGAARGKRTSVLLSLTTRLVSSVGIVGFGVEGNEMYRAVVEGVPEVLQTARLSGGHIPVGAITSEVQLTRGADVQIASVIAVGFMVS